MPPMSPNQIKSAYKSALTLQNSGADEQALQQYSAILETNPNLAEVHFQVATIFKKFFQYEKAVRHVNLATVLRPKELALWYLYSDILHILGSREYTKPALTLLKKSGLSSSNTKVIQNRIKADRKIEQPPLLSLGKDKMLALIALLNEGKLQEALDGASTLINAHSNVAVLHNLMGTVLTKLHRNDEAEACFKKALSLFPNYFEAHCQYGTFLTDNKRPQEAIIQFEKARIFSPQDSKVLFGLGIANIAADDLDKARSFFEKAQKISSLEAKSNYFLGVISAREGEHEESVKFHKRAIAKGYKTAQAYLELGIAQSIAGVDNNALASVETALKLNPEFPQAYYRLGLMKQVSGDFEESDTNFRKAISLNPKFGRAYAGLVAGKKLKFDDPLIEPMIALLDSTELENEERISLNFAASKIMEDAGKYDQVFGYLNAANDAVRREHPYDIQTRFTEISQLKEMLKDFDLSALQGKGHEGFAPIFVTGMPRSGTTLVEQIISSHSEVTGGGELGNARKMALAFLNDNQGAEEMRNAEWGKLGQSIEDAYKALMPRAARITDKAIPTYTMIGAIKAAIPNAKFIVVRRDPRDNLLSIYKNQFVEGTHGYAYNLSDLGAYYKTFVDMIDYWREKAPGSFYEIQYEELVASPEEQARALIQACDLDWEDDCLNFHQNKREVKTLSIYQVRQPMYSSSVKAWQRYESDLQPLFEALK